MQLIFQQSVFPQETEFPFELFEGSGLDNDQEIVFHTHECLEINYCVSGKGTYLIGNRKYDISEGDLFIINNKEYHMSINNGDLLMKVIHFSPEMVWRNDSAFDSRYLQTFFGWNDNFKHLYTDDIPMVKKIVAIINEIEEEWTLKQEGYQLMIKAALLKVLALLYRSYLNSGSTSQKAVKFQSDYNKLFTAITFIDNHFHEEIKLSDLATLANFAPNYFSKVFNDVMSTSVSMYINKRRIEHSCALLKHTNMNIGEIALKSGFNDISHFNKTFKSLQNTSPKQYRSQF